VVLSDALGALAAEGVHGSRSRDDFSAVPKAAGYAIFFTRLQSDAPVFEN
jgi:hypothetical protein